MMCIQNIIEDLAILKNSLPDGLMIGALCFSTNKAVLSPANQMSFSVAKRVRNLKTYYSIKYSKSNCLDSCILIENVEITTNSIASNKAENCFTESDIKDYTNWSGDDNSIHKGKNAVVPGLMILGSIIDFKTFEKPMTFKAKFIEALWVNTGYRIEQCKETYKVINDNDRLIMTLNMEELK